MKKSFLKQILTDLIEGENIDVYLAVLISVVIIFLNNFNLIQPSTLTSLTSGVLALLALILIGNRHRLNNITNKLGAVSSTEIKKEFTESLSDSLLNANEVWIVGIHAQDLIIRYIDLFKKKLEKGTKFKFLLVDPSGNACEMTALRFPGKVDKNQERQRIYSSINSLMELKGDIKDKRANLEIRTIDFLLGYGGVLIDPLSPNGKFFIQRYTFRISGGSAKPKFMYTRKDNSEWYNFILLEVNELFSASKIYEAKQDN